MSTFPGILGNLRPGPLLRTPHAASQLPLPAFGIRSCRTCVPFSPSSVGMLSYFCSLFLLSSFLALVLVLLRRLTTPLHLHPLPSRVGNVCGVVGDSEVRENWLIDTGCSSFFTSHFSTYLCLCHTMTCYPLSLCASTIECITHGIMLARPALSDDLT